MRYSQRREIVTSVDQNIWRCDACKVETSESNEYFYSGRDTFPKGWVKVLLEPEQGYLGEPPSGTHFCPSCWAPAAAVLKP